MTGRRVLGAGAAAVTLAGFLVSGGPAAAQDKGNAEPQVTCGAVLVDRSSWLDGRGVDVKSNGAREGTHFNCNSRASYVDGVLAGGRWQCAELVNRLYLIRGWISTTWSGNAGKPMWVNSPANLTKQVNGAVSYLGPGDVVDINVFYDGTFVSGHVLVVNAPRHITSGTVSLLSQNNSGVFRKPATITNGKVAVSGAGDGWTYHVIGVIHAP